MSILMRARRDAHQRLRAQAAAEGTVEPADRSAPQQLFLVARQRLQLAAAGGIADGERSVAFIDRHQIAPPDQLCWRLHWRWLVLLIRWKVQLLAR